jgi:hypothetical protein
MTLHWSNKDVDGAFESDTIQQLFSLRDNQRPAFLLLYLTSHQPAWSITDIHPNSKHGW